MTSLVEQCETEGCNNKRYGYSDTRITSRFCNSCIGARKQKSDLLLMSWYEPRQKDSLIMSKDEVKRLIDIAKDDG